MQRELTELFKRPRNEVTDRLFINGENRGDFRITEILVVAEHQHFVLPDGQAFEPGIQAKLLFFNILSLNDIKFFGKRNGKHFLVGKFPILQECRFF